MTRVLSLDDDAPMLELIGLILHRAGYEYTCTGSSYEALSVLKNESVDLFTQDIMRPDIDGWHFYSLIKSDETLRTIPVVIVTCQAQSVDKVMRLHQTYQDGYVTKPFGPQELLATFDKVLRAHSKSPPTEEERKRARIRREEATRYRAQLLEEIIATLPNVSLKGHAAIVHGQYGKYEVSLSNGQVTRLPRQRICIVPNRSLRLYPDMCLPFENTDINTDQIISTVLMLSADQNIRDETILRQLEEQANDNTPVRSRN